MTFDAQGGIAPNPAGKSATYDAAYGSLATTTRTGYTLAGWWMEAGGTGTEVTAATVVAIAGNHTLFAKWTANSYTVSFNAQGGYAPNPISTSATYGETYGPLATTTHTGYSFAGWWTGADGTGTEVTTALMMAMAADHILYAKWTGNSYSVAFDAPRRHRAEPGRQERDLR